jgi:hypothetical protein
MQSLTRRKRKVYNNSLLTQRQRSVRKDNLPCNNISKNKSQDQLEEKINNFHSPFTIGEELIEKLGPSFTWQFW